MKSVVWAAAAVSAAVLVGCSSAHVALDADSSVSVPVGGSLAISGIIQDSSGTILWKLDGPGSLSNTSGASTVYTAPSTYDPNANKAKLTVSASDDKDAKQEVQITITKPTASVGGVPGLVSTVTVTYDERDIPTISCTKSVDCYTVLGFIHARDRLFQMDFFRRAARAGWRSWWATQHSTRTSRSGPSSPRGPGSRCPRRSSPTRRRMSSSRPGSPRTPRGSMPSSLRSIRPLSRPS